MDGLLHDLKNLTFVGLFWQFFKYFCQIWLAKVERVEQEKAKKLMEF